MQPRPLRQLRPLWHHPSVRIKHALPSKCVLNVSFLVADFQPSSCVELGLQQSRFHAFDRKFVTASICKDIFQLSSVGEERIFGSPGDDQSIWS